MVCPTWNLSSVDDMLMLDYAFHQHNMYTYLAPLLTAQKPIFINQWGVVHGVTEEQGRYDYMSDMAALMEELNIGWTWWVFRGGGGDTWATGLK